MKTSLIILAALLWGAGLARAGEATLGICLGIPAIDPGTERDVVAFDRTSHFPVILTNNSDKPQRIITDWNSWGEQTLSFELTDKAGKTSVAHRVAVDYTKNTPHWWILQPRESMVLDVYFADPYRWTGFPDPAHYGDSETVTLRAVFEYHLAQEKLRTNGEWTGRVTSEPEQVVFCNRVPEK